MRRRGFFKSFAVALAAPAVVPSALSESREAPKKKYEAQAIIPPGNVPAYTFNNDSSVGYSGGYLFSKDRELVFSVGVAKEIKLS